MSELHVGVGSLNPVKLSGAEHAFVDAFPQKQIVMHAYDTVSGVSAQPLSREETIQGAKNRAHAVIEAALKDKAQLSYAVGLEGGVNLAYGEGMYVIEGYAWIIELGSSAISLGGSLPIPAPAALSRRLIEDKEELGSVMLEAFGDESLRTGIGANGFITNGDYTRENEFTDATRSALMKFIHSDKYDSVGYKKKSVRYTD